MIVRLPGSWTFRWTADLPITHWEGVTVERVVVDGVVVEESPLRVRALVLEDRGFTGSISPRLGDLQALETLVLSNNGLTGPIPSALGKLTALTWLDLSHTALIGTLPPELANLTNLTSVDITETALTGCIPGDFSAVWVDGSDPWQWRCPTASDP